MQSVKGPEISSVYSIACFGISAIVIGAVYYREIGINIPLCGFIVAAAISIAVNHPSPEFKAPQRLAAFIIALCALSPLVTGSAFAKMRLQMWRIMMWCLRIIVVCSCVRFVYLLATHMPSTGHDIASEFVGFPGITNLGMELSPISAIVTLDSVWLLTDKITHKFRRIALWCLAFAAALLTVCAGSRIAIAGLCVSMPLILYARRRYLILHWKGCLTTLATLVLTISIGWSILGTAVEYKNSYGIKKGGTVIHSRTERWHYRIEEFKDSPAFGVGFDVIPHDSAEFNNPASSDFKTPWESGSSWLSVLSMTGLCGTLFMAAFIVQLFMRLKRSVCTDRILLCALFIFLLINGIAEGWLTYAGGLMFMVFWLLAGITVASEKRPNNLIQSEN